MKAKTYLFGEIEVNPEKIIQFPKGVVGFENSQRFMLVHEPGQVEPSTYTLQSLDDPNLAFQIADPTVLGFHYELALSDEEARLLKNPAVEDLAVMLLLFRKESESTNGVAANVRAPLIINTKARLGIQKAIERLRSNVVLSNLASSV